MSTFDLAALLFAFAAFIGFVNDRVFGLPRGIALLIGSLGASLAALAAGTLTGHEAIVAAPEHRLQAAGLPRILLDGALALLLFAASLHLDLAGLRRNALPVLGLATAGVVIAAVVFTFGISAAFSMAGLDVPLGWCFLLGAIVAPTDAVAVESLLKQVPLPAGLRDIISGESLFNDGTAVVIVLAGLAIVSGEKEVVGHGRLLVSLVVEALGGALIGVASGALARLAVRRSLDENVVITISIALALGSYRLAAHWGVSGPIAVVAAGLTLANGAHAAGGAVPQERLGQFWSSLDDLVNTLMFLLMGVQIFTFARDDVAIVPVLVAIPLALLARFASVMLPLAVLPVKVAHKGRAVAALTWLGLRGAVSVALVLTIPEGPWTATLEAVCYAIVVFTIVVQGLSTPRVLRALYPSHATAGPDATAASGM